MVDRRAFLKAGAILLPAIVMLPGCAGPAKYDLAKYGSIKRLGVLAFSSNDIEFWADIDRSSNMYSAAGANNGKAERFSQALGIDIADFYPKMLNAISDTLQKKNVESRLITVPRTAGGRASTNYSVIDEPLLLECRVYLGFMLVDDGVMPSATTFYRLVGADGTVMFEKHISLGYGKRYGLMDTEILALPELRYENEWYIMDHSAEVAKNLVGFAEPLGRAVAITLLNNT